MTQFGRALAELNIEILCANSSQAKGRVERVNRTLQDRLVKDLRLAGISSIEAGNAFLPGFMARFNTRFAVAPARMIPDPDDQFATAVAGHQAKLVSALMVSGMAARVEQRSPKARSRSLRVGKCLFATASLVSGHSRSAGCSSGV